MTSNNSLYVPPGATDSFPAGASADVEEIPLAELAPEKNGEYDLKHAFETHLAPVWTDTLYSDIRWSIVADVSYLPSKEDTLDYVRKDALETLYEVSDLKDGLYPQILIEYAVDEFVRLGADYVDKIYKQHDPLDFAQKEESKYYLKLGEETL